MDSSCHGEYSGVGSHSMDKLSNLYNAQEPEPLGSVTHNQGIDGSSTSLQIRSSARVSKKMRLETIATPIAAVVLDKIDIKKEPTKDDKSDKPEKPEKSDRHEKVDKHDKADAKQNEVKPKKRAWELWSQEDKNTFFEALNEYGKDFDAIQNYFATKGKKKGLAEHLIKTRDQLRHFYYRTWHKVSKHLKFDETLSSSGEVKNAAKELYGLINYGEIRRKVGFCTEKIMCTKLNDLVYRGSIQIRVKGKTLRIKTPLCRALRKLNRVEEHQEDLKLPARAVIELQPRTNEAWTRVQSASQNPRIRTLLPLQKRLSAFLAYLSHRWQPHNLKHREKLKDILCNTNAECAEAMAAEDKDKKKEKEPLLRVAPYPGVQICLPTVNLTEYLTSSSLCLSSYEERLRAWKAEGSLYRPTGKRGWKGCISRKVVKRQRVDSTSDKKPTSEVVPAKQKENPCPETVFVNCGVTIDTASDNNVERDTMISRVGGDIDMAVDQILSLQQRQAEDAGCSNTKLPAEPELKEEVNNKTTATAQPSTSAAPETKVDDAEDIINRIRAGWTIEDANSISIGELYLMFGSETKIKMQYWWENPPPDPAPVLDPVSVSDVNPLQGPAEAEKSDTSNSRLAETLQKLISIAKLNFIKAKVVCPCGHICGMPKAAVNMRRPQPINGPCIQPLRPAVSVSVTSMHDGVFRRPLLAPSQFKPQAKPGTVEAFKAQLEKFRPKYCNRRGRSVRPKNVVVQRMLPLLPKAPNGHAMVTVKVIPQTSQLSGEFLPIGTTVPANPQASHSQPTPLLPCPTKNPHILPAISSKSSSNRLIVPSTSADGLPDLGQDKTPVTLHQNAGDSGAIGVTSRVPAGSSLQNNVPVNNNAVGLQQIALPQNDGAMNLHHVALTTGANSLSTAVVSNVSSTASSPQLPIRSSSPTLNTPVASPPSISNLLELSLPSTVGEDLTIAAGTDNGLLDVPIQDPSSVGQPSFVGLLPSKGTLQNSGTPPTSPTRILKEADTQWLNPEDADFSLSSFLGHLESPLKPAAAPPTEDTRLCSDVEAQLQCLMSENSVDYMAKFADLAAQIASSDTSNKK